MNLTDIDSLKLYLDIGDDKTQKDDQLEELIVFVSSLFESYCERDFGFDTHTYVSYPIDDIIDTIYLPNTPVVDVSAIIVDGTDITSTVGYRIDKLGGKIIFDSSFSCDEIEIVYSGGYTESNLPNEIKFACNIQTAFFFQRRDNIGLRQVSMEGSFTTEARYTLLNQVLDVLNKYRYVNI
jgi:hypothetical protein